MKKIFSFLAVALLALGFAACEDVPAPYGINDEILGDGSKQLPFAQSFENSLGAYKSYTLTGEGRWTSDHKAAVASGYNSATQVTTAGSYILVSPEISLVNVKKAHFVFDYVLRYFKTAENQKLMITKTFDANQPGEGWTNIPVTLKEVQDWNDVQQADVNLPAEFMGSKVRLAFYYNTPATKGSTWQLKNCIVLEGEAADGGEDKPVVGVKELPYSEPFTSDMGGFQNYTTSGAGAWAVDSRGFAKASGFTAKDQPAIQGVYYMVSPEISLAGKKEAHFSYEYINSFNDDPLNHQFVINPNFDESKPAEGWVALKADHEKTSSWTDWKKADIQIPAEYMGKNVRVAFRYECKTERASTFEVKNFNAAEGKAESGNDPVKPEEGVQKLPYKEDFSSTLGLFKNFTTSGAGEWKIDYHTAKASGYDNISKVTTDGTYYLVSPAISLEGQTEAHLVYDYICRYVASEDNQKVLISTSFDEAKPTEGWTLLNNKHVEGTDWTTFSKADIQIPAEYMGKTIRIALYYNCENQKGSTWEVKNFSIAAGKIGEDGNEGGDTPDTGDVTASNGDFETWVDGMPNNWKSASTASNAELSQSTDAHSGKFSVCVAGNPKSNKRLAYKELNLKAGNYTMKFFVKAATSAGGSARPAYVIVPESGKLSGDSYKYGDYVNDLTPTEWKEVTHQFTIDADGTFCMAIMNPKNPGQDILVDDFTLTDASGKVIIK